MSESFRKVVREMREDWGVREVSEIDWDTVDKGLFDRLDRERREEHARFTKGRSGRWGFALAGTLAAAAVLLLTFGKGRDKAPDSDVRATTVLSGGMIVGIEGRALVNHAAVARGAELHLGDVIEAFGRVTIDRPGRLTLVLERDSSATITHVEGALVLALERGAVEASVVPVAAGEAFAVDLEHARIAVHGTHLRVARTGSRAVVDLSEGVVSIGQAPRIGTVLGTVIVAPAHAEFAVADAQGTLSVTHDASAVRATTAFVAASPVVPPPPVLPVEEKVDASSTRMAVVPIAVRAERPAASSAPVTIPSEAETTAAVASAVRACMAARPPAENVTLVVQTTLYLGLQDDGTVRSARFDPPVAPDVNECATPTIYKARFSHGGSTSLVLSYVSR